MINLYKKDETTFEHNGLGSLDNNILNPEINWKDNGAFTLEFKYPLFAKHGFEIENSSIVRANDPEGSNLFFVYKITPSMGYVTVLCYQISYKLAFNSINDTNIVNKNGQNALSQMSNVTQYPHGFVFSSDIQTTATSRVVSKNPIEFLLDTSLDNSFVNRWGGHIVRHDFNIAMNSAYGSNKGYTIRHKKDLKGYEAEFDESTVITRIRPVGYDGLLLPELYVDSPLIDNYTEPRIQQIEYSDVKVKQKSDDEEGFSTPELAYAELRRLANLEFSKNKVDVPSFSCKVEFVNLKDTQEYKDLKSLKQILAGDTVKVIHAEDNFNIEAQMVEYKWNPLNQSYISITLGNYTKSFTSTVSKASSMQTNLNQVAQQAQSAWSAANGKNAVYSLTYKPTITGSSVEGDLLYLKNGDKTELWILEKVNGKLQWVLQVSDATQEELKAQMQQAQNDIKDAVDSVNNAVDKANANVQAIEANTQLIDDVNAIANNAKSQAQTADTNAQTALTSANTAITNANKAIGDAGKLSEDVLALDTIANQAKSDADTALINANKGITDAKTALNKAIGVDTRLTTEITNVNNTLATKANSKTVDALSDTVSSQGTEISQNATDIKLKADSTVVNAIEGAVDSQGTLIEQNASDIALKANKSSVDTLTGRVSANETAIDVTSQGISTLVTKTDNTNTSLSQFKQDYEGFKGTVYTKGQTDTKVSTVQQSVDQFKTTVSNTYATKDLALQYKGTIVGTDSADNLADGWYSLGGWKNLVSGIVWGKLTSQGNNNISDVAQVAVIRNGDTYTRAKQGNPPTWSDWQQSANKVDIANVNQLITTQQTSIDQNANQIALKADTTTVNTLTGRVTTAEGNITTMAGQISLKANKTDVDTVKGRVTSAEGSISLISGQVALKANQTDVNTTNGKVSSLESSFTVQSGQITALNTKTDGQTTKIGSLQSSYDGLTSTVASVENSLQQNNLVYNATLQGGSDGWGLNNGYTQSSYRDINGNYIIDFSLASNENSTWYFARSKQVPIGNYKTFSYAANLMRRTDIANSGVFALGIEGFDSTGKRIEYKSTNYNYQLIDDWWKVVSDSYTFTNPDVKTVCFTLATNGFGHYIACQPILVTGSKVGSFVPDRVDKSQVTQLTQDLSGFKTTVANTYLSKSDASGTYADKVSVASQITQSATAVTSDVQSWTDNKLIAYSTTQQTATSITNAVANKADKSQVTQLSNQITSTVTGITNESLFSTQMISSTTLKHPNYPGMPMVEIPVTNGESYTVSSNLPNGGTAAAPTAHVWFLRLPETVPTSNINGVYDGKSITLPALSDKIYIVFRNQSYADKFISGQYWVKVIATPASQSQITQLSTDINLRVSKGGVTSQINIESGRTLIDTKQLLLSADTVKFTGSAFIPDAMIQNLTASKINTGTLNAANVNIINLNASNISAGTITGPNLSINLNSGEVLFQKGIIKRQDGNFSVDITNGILESYTSSGGYTLQDGEISFRDTSAWKPNSREKYGGIGYNNFPGGIWSGAVSGISVRGNEGWAIGTSNSDVGGTEATKGSLIAGGLERATFAAKKQITITAGDVYKNSIFSAPPAIQVGTGNSSNEILISSKLTTIGDVLVSELIVDRKATISQSLTANSLNVTGSKNAIHATRNGVRATPAYETAESYLGDIGSNYTREDCEVWIDIDKLFSDTVNTDITYQVFLQAYDDTNFWVADFKSEKFLIKSDKPMSRFAWEIKAKRRGYENDRLVLQDDFDNEKIEESWREK